jgi:hypothetical protein
MHVVLWPSFLVAIIAEGAFFSVFDPHESSLMDSHMELTPIAVYTIGFFCFWMFCALASMLTCYLISVPDDRCEDQGKP